MPCCGRSSSGRKAKKSTVSKSDHKAVTVLGGPYRGKTGTVIAELRLGVYEVMLTGKSQTKTFVGALLRFN